MSHDYLQPDSTKGPMLDEDGLASQNNLPPLTTLLFVRAIHAVCHIVTELVTIDADLICRTLELVGRAEERRRFDV